KVGALPPHPLEVEARQRVEGRRPFRGYRGRAHGMPKEAHFADNRVGRDASHAQSLAAARRDIDRKAAGGNDVDGFGRIALPLQHGRAIDLSPVEIGDEVSRVRAGSKLSLQPGLEAAAVHADLDLRLGEQSVLAPGERNVEVGKGLVLALAANEASALE